MTRARPPQRHRPRRRGRPQARRRRHRQPAGRRAAHRPGAARPARRTCSSDDRDADMATLAVPITADGAVAQPELRQGGLRRAAAGPCTSAAARSRSSATASRTSPPGRRASCSTSACTPTAATFLLRAGDAAAGRRWSSWRSWNSSASWPLGRPIQVGVVAARRPRRRHAGGLRAVRRGCTGRAGAGRAGLSRACTGWPAGESV